MLFLGVKCREEVMEMPRLDVFETGNEPDYYITDILRMEPAGEHDIRIYLASRRNNVLRLEYSAVVSRDALRPMAQQLIEMADSLDGPCNIVKFPTGPR
jgi:hypothetical protein